MTGDGRSGSGGGRRASASPPAGATPSGGLDPTSGIPLRGAIIADKYEIEQVIGVGGMGVVVAAKHVHLGHRVAIKFIRGEAAADQQAVTRFLREAQATVALTSEHVTRVFDAGGLDSGTAYMVMELLTGTDLADLLRRRGPLDVPEVIDFVLQACEALAEAHTKGIVHRDLKPSNLFVTRRADGSRLVKVLDFGISKMMVADPSGMRQDLTGSRSMMGSPIYMSPEQVRSARDVDARSDVWALGVILYELLAGSSPFAGETLGETFARILGEDPAPLRAARHDVPAGLASVITRALERDVGRRFQTVGELAVELLPFGPAGAATSVERILRVYREGTAERQNDTAGSPDGTPARRDRKFADDFSSPGAQNATRTADPGTGSPWQTSSHDGRAAGSRRGASRAIAMLGAAVAVAAVGLMVFGWKLRAHSSAPSTAAIAEPGPPTQATTEGSPVPAAPSPSRVQLEQEHEPAAARVAPLAETSTPHADGRDAGAPRAPAVHPAARARPARSAPEASPVPSTHPTATSNETDIF